MWSELLDLLRRQPARAIGFVIVGMLVLVALAADLIAPFDPELSDPRLILAPPGWPSLFGRDSAGMDVFSRVVYGARVDLTVAVAVTALSAAIGLPIGVISGYLRGAVPETLGRLFDVIQSFPVFVLALAIVAARGPSIVNVVVVISVLYSPLFVRLMRSQTYALRDRAFIDSAKVSGNSDLGVVFRHLIPNAMGPAVAQMSVTAGFAILLTSGLSFVGAGLRPPTPEWGAMVAVGAATIVTGEWWAAIFPSIAIGLAVLGFALVGETLEIALNPRKG